MCDPCRLNGRALCMDSNVLDSSLTQYESIYSRHRRLFQNNIISSVENVYISHCKCWTDRGRMAIDGSDNGLPKH